MTLDETYTIDLCVSRCWSVRLWCDCGHEVVWGVERLRGFPGRLTIQALANSAECKACRQVGARVQLRQDHGATRDQDAVRNAAQEAARGPGQLSAH